MSKVSEKPDLDEPLRPSGAGERCSPEHEAWLRTTIAETLEKAKSGKLNYRSLDDVAKDFGFDAS